MIYDYIIVGHGLAGSILAHTLSGMGSKIVVMDQPKANSASNVAAGLMNPLAGKRFAKSWLVDTLMPFATDFYRTLEAQTNTNLFQQKPILKLFSSIEEQNNWMGKSAGTGYSDFIKEVISSLPPSDKIYQEFGGIVIDKGGFVDVPLLLKTLQKIRESRNEINIGVFEYSELDISEDLLKYQDILARNIIFCEGYKGFENPYFSWLPFSLNKGEVLDIQTEELPGEYVYNKAVYALKSGLNQMRVGATYNWRNVDENETEDAKIELTKKLEGLLKQPYSVINQKAGIRPATRDRRPFIGEYPKDARIKIFNGMGSKGVMLAPYLASHFAAYLNAKEELLPEINILRYLTLYQEQSKLT